MLFGTLSGIFRPDRCGGVVGVRTQPEGTGRDRFQVKIDDQTYHFNIQILFWKTHNPNKQYINVYEHDILQHIIYKGRNVNICFIELALSHMEIYGNAENLNLVERSRPPLNQVKV